MTQFQSHARHDFSEILVFTGDLVGSSKLSADDLTRAMNALEEASYDVMRAHSHFHTRFTRFEGDKARGSPAFSPDWEPRFSKFRGDGWQCVFADPAFALRDTLILRATLSSLGKAFDTRISIGIGSGWIAGTENLNAASGRAFELSGQGLDEIGQSRRFAVAWEDPPEEAPLIQAIFALADEISRNWTPGQAKVFAHLLVEIPRPRQERLAAALGITQQSVATHLSGGGDWALREALRALEAPR